MSRLPRPAIARLGFVSAIAVASIFAVIGPRMAHAQDNPGCITSDEVKAAAQKASDADEGSSVLVIDGEEVAKIADVLNAIPPVTHVKIDKIIAVKHKDGSVAAAAIIHGCMDDEGPIPYSAEDWAKLMDAALGDRS